jgi:predicted RNA-binding Zn-ribbon protein involved in translation (DUF1610 family)
VFSNYILEKQAKSFCPQCNKPVWLLMHKAEVTQLPAFYICFGCEWLGQVGVGRVLSAKAYCHIDMCDEDEESITCLVCGHTSKDPDHMDMFYCPECKAFHADRALSVLAPPEVLPYQKKDPSQPQGPDG